MTYKISQNENFIAVYIFSNISTLQADRIEQIH